MLLSNYSAILKIAIPLEVIDYEIHNVKTNIDHLLEYNLDELGHSEIGMISLPEYQVIELHVSSPESFETIQGNGDEIQGVLNKVFVPLFLLAMLFFFSGLWFLSKHKKN